MRPQQRPTTHLLEPQPVHLAAGSSYGPRWPIPRGFLHLRLDDLRAVVPWILSTFQHEKRPGGGVCFFLSAIAWNRARTRRNKIFFLSSPTTVVWFERTSFSEAWRCQPQTLNWQVVWQNHALRIRPSWESSSSDVLEPRRHRRPCQCLRSSAAIVSKHALEEKKKRACGPAHSIYVVLASVSCSESGMMRCAAYSRVQIRARLLPLLGHSTTGRASRRQKLHGSLWIPASSRCPNCVLTQVRNACVSVTYIRGFGSRNLQAYWSG